MCRKHLLQMCRCILLVCMCALGFLQTAAAEEEEVDTEPYYEIFSDQLSYEEMDAFLEENEQEISFSELVDELLLSEEGISLKGILQLFGKVVMQGTKTYVRLMVQLLILLLASAVFTAFSNGFHNPQVAQTAEFAAFLMLSVVLVDSYLQAFQLAADTLRVLMDYLRVFTPIYIAAITFSVGISSANAFYELYLILMLLVQEVVNVVLFPLCSLYLMLAISDELPMEHALEGFADLVRRFLLWGRRCILALATGFSLLRGIITPGIDKLQKKTLVRALSAIPGIGNLFSGVTETVMGAGLVLKNAVGTVGCLIFLVLASKPLMGLFLYQLMFRLAEAMAKTVADKSMAGCLAAAAEAVAQLLSLLAVCMLACLITLVIMTVTTGN